MLGAVAIMATGWHWLDPAVAIAVSAAFAWTAWGLLCDALRLELDGVPAAIERRAVADWLATQEGVRDVHDLHIWALSTTRAALAVHLVWQGEDRDAFLDHVAHRLAEGFGFAHATIQIKSAPCDFACEPVAGRA